MQEFNDVKELFGAQRSKYARYKILYDAVWDCAFSDSLDNNLRLKLQDILLASDCAHLVGLKTGGFSKNSQELVELTNVASQELTYDESLKLKKALESILQNKHKSVCRQFFKITGKDVNIDITTEELGDLNLSNGDETLFKLRGQLQEQNKKYVGNLVKEQKILEDIVELRLGRLPKVCDEKIKESQFKARISELQTKIVHERTRIDIFMETNSSLLAYEELMKDIKEQQEECQRDIQHLKKLKKEYQHIACKQYDELLKSFIQYKLSLAKKTKMYESLCN